MVRGPRHITPALLAAHYFTLQYHISNRTISATFCVAPHFTFYVPYNTPFHVLHATFQITLYIGHITTSRTTPHCTAFHRPLHMHNCIIPPHLTVVTPNSTSHYHVSHNIPHHTSVHHHILHHTTYHILRNTTSTTTSRLVTAHTLPHCTSHTIPHSIPQPTLYLVPHHTTFHIPSQSPHTTSFHITTFHIPSHSPHSTSFHITQRSTFHPTAHTLRRSTSHTVPHSMPQHTHFTPTLSAITPRFQFERLD